MLLTGRCYLRPMERLQHDGSISNGFRDLSLLGGLVIRAAEPHHRSTSAKPV
jgi:hypothetical protein